MTKYELLLKAKDDFVAKVTKQDRVNDCTIRMVQSLENDLEQMTIADAMKVEV